jgi:endonuclease/exonuclease/phosphatase family metal-dependent hydrolase
VIASCEPDIVALQEVRVGRTKPGGVDQAAVVAHALGMDLHFQPTIRMFGEQFGIAVLTRHPSRLVQSGRLPTFATGRRSKSAARSGPRSRSAAAICRS